LKRASFWVDSTPETAFPALTGSASVDVAVVGAGITGLTAALLLTRAGKRVAVIESKRIVHGATGYTTAKVTSSHGAVYKQLIAQFGEEGARIYGESNEAALARIARFVEEERIDCDFSRRSNYLYAATAEDRETVEQEAEAAAKAGLPATFVEEAPLPFPTASAVRFENQAQFHPRKYLLAFADAIVRDGGHVFEGTRALAVEEGDRCRVRTDKGDVTAADVIVATQLPFLNRGLFFAKAHPYRSYVVCPRVDSTRDPVDMFVSTETPTHTVRSSPYENDVLLIIAGEGHKVGEHPNTEERYGALERWTREHFEVQSFEYRWSTQDYYSVDHVPYIGRLTRRSRHVFVATGYNAWGLTNGTLAAMLLSDAVLGVENPWAGLYDAKRLAPKASATMFVKENVKVALRWFGDRARTGDRDAVSRLQPGEGAVVRIGGKTVAVHRDGEGGVHALSAVCTHLGCIVHWNTAEQSWDCPCHGSRFASDGAVIQGPAVRDLEPRDEVLS
jgi:glycine/D-amino acid oxidase-like deaminating enzyme/nitrite reductase/ring-hydroxylating ferredoxin subunit